MSTAEASTAPNPELQALAGDPLAALRAQLAGQAQDNPGIALLMQWLDQRGQTPPAAAAEDAAAPGADAAAAAPAPAMDEAIRTDLQTLLAHSSAQAAELEALRQRNDALAAALGACHLCFGEDAWCPHCGGRGLPGSRRPDAVSFKRYLRPLLLRLQRTLPVVGDPAAPVPNRPPTRTPTRDPTPAGPIRGAGDSVPTL